MPTPSRGDLVFWTSEPEPRNRFMCFFICFFVVIGIASCYSVESNLKLVDYIAEKRHHNSDPVCSNIPDASKFDCHPDLGASADSCRKRSCCFQPVSEHGDIGSLRTPWCFYPSDYRGYVIEKVLQDGKQIRASLKRRIPSGFPKDIQNLNLVISFLDDFTLRLKITDLNTYRFEVPIPINSKSKPLQKPCYDVDMDSNGKLSIVRKSSQTVIFSTNFSQLVYADQFLQLSVDLPSFDLYGLGEHYGPLKRNLNWNRITLFNSDRGPTANYPNYGTQPFYLSMERDGKANGVFLLNSNAMDVILQPKPAVTFRPIGGILDFFILLGPSPENVVQQYTGIVGRTFMPPYWSFGFQLCRYGYNSLNKTRETVQRTIEAGIPLQVQWNDIDFMDRRKDFTYDEQNFAGLPDFVDELHKKGMHYILMTDPGISASEKQGNYPPYDDGIMQDIFIKNPNGSIFHGKVWTDGDTVYPDFSHPYSDAYWTKQFYDFHQKIKFDGIWIDMNEPSNFYDGRKDGCDKSSYEDPYYLPNGNLPLRHRTVCMTAKHFSTIHYNEHNIYGYREAMATNKALRMVRGKRPFIISRASYSGQGTQSGHWSGDIMSSWEDLRYSVSSILSFNMFGVSMVGSDICGFGGDTTVELCSRWQSVGAFYTFARNHNSLGAMEQDPAFLGPVVMEATKNSLSYRYYFLPYLYTLFYRSHVFGDTVIRPLFFEFPYDKNTYALEEQFLWGSAIMIMPVLYPNVTSVTAYFPEGTWYSKFGAPMKSKGENITLPSNETDIQLAFRSGYVFPAQVPAMTTTESRKNPFALLITLDDRQEAYGELYWDDGDSLDTYEKGKYNLIEFIVANNKLQSKVIKKAYSDKMLLGEISMAGLESKPTKITVNGVNCQMMLNSKSSTFPPNINFKSLPQVKNRGTTCEAQFREGVLNIGTTNMSLLSPLEVEWS